MNSSDPVDVVGVGFGPSNLALAIAIEEHNRTSDPSERITSHFVEKQHRFGWHRGMLLPGTTMQISFLKDLVTQRNSCSEFSFLNYLSERGRLVHFINQQSFFPTRLEFHDYLEWAAGRVNASVQYGATATGVLWDGEAFEVQIDGMPSVRGRSLVLAGGLSAKLPADIRPSARVFHNHRLLDHIQEIPSLRHQRFVVVGSGQSAAEVAAHLHDLYRDAEIHAVFGKYGYTPADDSPYANRIFDPEAVMDFHQSSTELRQQLLDYHRGTNYSAVDPPLIEELYRREYTERVSGRRRLFVRGASEISKVVESDTGVAVRVEHRPSQDVLDLDCDAIVFATGFRPTGLTDLLGALAGECELDELGRPLVARDYQLMTSDRIGGAIYLQGNTEHSHGLTSTLLSNLAVRSGELVTSLADARSGSGRATTEGEQILVHQSL